MFTAAALVMLGAQAKPPQPPTVVASNAVVADLVRVIAQEDVRVVTLACAGADAHHAEPTVSDAKAIASAAAVFTIGLGLDTAIAKLRGGSPNAGVIELGTGLGLARGGQHSHAGHDHEEGSGHEAAQFDPHLWHDPTKVGLMVERISKALGDLRPECAERFSARAAAYGKELATLDEWISKQVGAVPAEKRLLVTTHDGLRYFAARYGFRLVGLEMGHDGEGTADPSPAAVARLVEAVRATKAAVVFADSTTPSPIERTVAKEAGVKLDDGVRFDGLAKGSTYLDLMRSNTTCIVKALTP